MRQHHSFKVSIFYSLFGLGAPLLAGLISIPLLLKLLDGPRYAFVSLTWIIIGYTSVLDLGLGRSLTKQVPAILIRKGSVGVLQIVKRSIRMMLIISLVGVTLFWLFNGYIVGIFGKVPPSLLSEARSSLFLIGAAVPAIVLSSGYRGALEGLGRFQMTGLIRAASGSLMFLVPVAVAFIAPSLPWLTASLVMTRYFTLAALWMSYRSAVSVLPTHVQGGDGVELDSSAGLLREASWMTVSNIVSPLLVYMDRFFVSRILGLGIVPFYSAPYDVVSRLTIIPEAVFAVLFPRMSGAHALGAAELQKTHSLSLRGIGVLMFASSLLLITIAPIFLKLLLGVEFMNKSTGVMSILLVGVFVNTCARPPYNVLQATGFAKTTGILHLCEFAPYVVLLSTLTTKFGIEGAAMAWTLRAAFDAAALTVACGRTLGSAKSAVTILMTVATASAALAGVGMVADPTTRLVIGMSIFLASLLICYHGLISNEERLFAHSRAMATMAALRSGNLKIGRS